MLTIDLSGPVECTAESDPACFQDGPVLEGRRPLSGGQNSTRTEMDRGDGMGMIMWPLEVALARCWRSSFGWLRALLSLRGQKITQSFLPYPQNGSAAVRDPPRGAMATRDPD